MEDYRIYEKLGPAKYLYMSALNKINNTNKLLNLHAGNFDVHVSKEEKARWNAKMDSSEFGNLTDLTARVSHLENVSGTIPTKTSQLLNDSGFISQQDIDFDTVEQSILSLQSNVSSNATAISTNRQDIVKLKQDFANLQIPTSGGVDDIDLSDYAKITYVSSLLSQYVKPTDLKTINGRSLIGSGDITISGGTSSGDQVTYTIEQWFKITNDKTTPTLPQTTDPSSEGWKLNAGNATQNQYVWMIFRWNEVNGSYGIWYGPFVISSKDGVGKDGKDGINGTEIEYIYSTTKDETISPTQITYIANSGKTAQDDDFVPNGWTDNPTGVSPNMRCEWMAFRTKVYNPATQDYEWNSFVGPTPWSVYGKQGIDGDGVEYIFCVNPTKPTGVNDPSSWTLDADFQNPEYIKVGTIWNDDPVDMSTLGQGTKQWVSYRKQLNGVWQNYSEPSLWAYYAMDGVVNSVTVDTDNDFIGVPLNSNGTNAYLKQTINVAAYNGLESIDNYSVSVDSASSDKMPYISTEFFSVQADNKSVLATLPIGAINFSNTGNIMLRLKVQIVINSATVVRYAIVQFAGVMIGEDGSSYQLSTDAKQIKNSNNQNAPSQISVWCKRTKANEIISSIYPSDTGSMFTFKYFINGDESTIKTLTTNTISTQGIFSSLTITMEYSGQLIDKETIYVVRDGVEGAPAVVYQPELITDSIVGEYVDDSLKYFGTATFKVSKREGLNNPTYLTLDDVNVQASSGVFQVTYDAQVFTVTATGLETITSPMAIPVIIKTKDSSQILCSFAIPVSIKGKQGIPGETKIVTQPMQAVVTRVTVWALGSSYYAGEATSDGYKYLDFAIYGNSYYKCISSINNSTISPDQDTQHWQQVTTVLSDAYIENVVSQTAFVEDLTSKNVIITDDYNNVVAGMISGDSVPQEVSDDQNNYGVRIWAGQLAQGDISSAPFTVREDGYVKATNADISGTILATSLDITNSGGKPAGQIHGYVYFAWENAFTDSKGVSQKSGVYMHVWDDSTKQYLLLPMSALVTKGSEGTPEIFYSSVNLNGGTPVAYTYNKTEGKYYYNGNLVNGDVYYKSSGTVVLQTKGAGSIASDPEAVLATVYSADAYTKCSIVSGVLSKLFNYIVVIHIGASNYYVNTVAQKRFADSADDAYQDISTGNIVTAYSTAQTTLTTLPNSMQIPQF